MHKKQPLKFWVQKFQHSFYPLIFLTVTAGIFRLLFINLIPFRLDEAQALFTIIEFLKNPYLIEVAGKSSIGVNYFPLQYYILAILGLSTTNPVGLSFVIALINTLLIPIFYLIVKKYYGFLVAFISALVIALSPWSILFSRKIWNPDLVLFLLIPTIYFLHKLIIDKQQKYSAPFFIFLLLLIQLQFSNIFFILAIFFVILKFKVKLDYKQALVGTIIGLIPAVPYFLHQLNPEDTCEDCQSFFNHFESINLTKYFDFSDFLRPLQIISGAHFSSILDIDNPLFISKYPFIRFINLIFIPTMLFPILGIYSTFKKNRYTFLAWLVILTVCLMFISGAPSHMYYFIVLTPFIAILYGLGALFIFEKIKNRLGFSLKFLLSIIILGPFVANIIFITTFFNFLSNRKYIEGDYGPIFSYTRDMVEKYLIEYKDLEYYEQLKLYAYIYVNAPNYDFHSKLGEYFASKGEIDPAVREFKKSLQSKNPAKSTTPNLIYIYIIANRFDEASLLLSTLEKTNPPQADNLRNIMIKLQNK